MTDKNYVGINLDVYTTHGDIRTRTFKARMSKWKLLGAIDSVENLCIGVLLAMDVSGKKHLTRSEILSTFRLCLAEHHEKLSKVTGKNPRYTMKQALRALKETLGVDIKKED